MRLASIVHLYRVRLRARLVQELLALAGISVGVALVFAALVANTSLTGSMRQLTDAIVGDAKVEVASRGPDGLDGDVVADIRSVDGARAVAPILEARVNLVGPAARRSVLLIGADASFAQLDGAMLPWLSAPELRTQRALALPDPIARELGVGLGESIDVEVGARTVPLPLATKLERGDVGALVETPVALAPLSVVQGLTGNRGAASRVFVRPEAGREAAVEERLRSVAGDRLSVREAAAEVAVFEEAAYPTNQSTALFSVLSALVGFLFAFSAMLLTVPQRRRLVADLRMAGYELWVMVQLLLFDALVLGLVGSIVGLGLGDQLSRHLFDATPGYLSAAFPVGSQRIVTWSTVAIACAAGIVAACVAVLAPLRETFRSGSPTRPTGPGPSRGERLSAVAGIGALATTTVIVLAVPDAAIVGIVTLTLALLLLLPILLRLATSALEWVGRPVKSPVPVLAVLEMRSRSAQTRTLALAATGAVAVFATVAIGGAHGDLRRGLDASARGIDANADIWVTFAGSANTLATTSFPAPMPETARLEELPGVAAVRPYRGGFLDVGDHRAWVLAPPATAPVPIPAAQIRHGDPAVATARLRRGGWLALSQAIADEEGVAVGDRLRLRSPVPTAFRVAAIVTNLGWPPGAIVMNAGDYARAWGTRELSALHLETAGRPAAAVAERVRQVLGDDRPLRVETSAARTKRHYGTARDGLARLTQISILVLISAILAMTAAMGGMIWQRRSSIAALKVHGYPDSELWRALLLESGLLLGTGCLIGAVFGLYGQVVMSRALEAITGFPVLYSAAIVGAVATLGVVTLVAVAMLALPGWMAVRVRPAPGAQT